MKKQIRLYEAFAGIGSQYYALKNIANNLNFEVISLGAIDWYIDAIISYQILHHESEIDFNSNLTKDEMISKLKNFTFSADAKTPLKENYFSKMKEEKLKKIFPYLNNFIKNNPNELNNLKENKDNRMNFSDITKVKTIPKNIDIFTYSFPCQDLSQQGKQKGLSRSTRSGLLWQIEQILINNKDRLPKVLLMENVKALTQKRFSADFDKWIKALENLGYKSKFKVLNAVDYGSCQNRERVFMISVLNGNISWPKAFKHENTLERIMDFEYESNESKLQELILKERTEFKITKNNIKKSYIKNYSNFNSEAFLYSPTGFGPTLTATGANSRLKFLFEEDNRIRSMNAIEAYQYMGFRKEDALKVFNKNVINTTKMIFTCGNSISVEVLEAIFKEIVKNLNESEK